MTGFSLRNLHYMRAFARAWPTESPSSIVQQPAAQLPWSHNMVILDKLKNADDRTWYARQAVENGWSRKVLQAQIATDLRGRQGGALTSFEQTLPASDSELVRDAIKDPYNFEFLGLVGRAKERELEQALLNDIQSFLMEMGRGFALVGRQFPLRIVDEETGEDHEFFIDLLFYNYLLRRFVVIDLKVEDFKPEFTGKMSFYLTAVDELERQPGDEPSIGLVLCPGRSRTVKGSGGVGASSATVYVSVLFVLLGARCNSDMPSYQPFTLTVLATYAAQNSHLRTAGQYDHSPVHASHPTNRRGIPGACADRAHLRRPADRQDDAQHRDRRDRPPDANAHARRRSDIADRPARPGWLHRRP